MKIFKAFCRQQFHVLTAYRLSFWMTLFNTFIRIYAYVMLWKILFNQNTSLFNIDLDQMLIYSIASIAMSQSFTWWDGPHLYVVENVKNGKIITDFLKPIDFEIQLFYRGFSQAIVNFVCYTIPTFLISIIVLRIKIPFNNICLTIVFLFLGYVILFLLNYILALISFITLDLEGYLHIFHAIIAFCSGQVIPLWLYPGFLRHIIDFLPFKAVFFIPLSIFIADSSINVVNSLLIQILWILVLFLIGRVIWKFVFKKMIIQGG